MAKFCPKCEKSLELSTTTGELIFKCPVCQEQVKGSPYDTLMPANYVTIEENVELWHNIIQNAPFDRVSEKVDIACKKCGRDYLTRLRLGKNESIVYSCKCGFNSINDPVVVTSKSKPEKQEIKGQAETPKIQETNIADTIVNKKDIHPVPVGIKFLTFNNYKFPKSGNKISLAAFDYDYTLFKPLASQFPRNSDDYILLKKTIPKTLEELSKTHLIVVFSNQSKRSDVMVERIKQSIVQHKLPVNYAFVAVEDEYRKPSTVMYDEMIKQLGIASVDAATSFYCGDDYNGSDKEFASNIKLTFKKPEDVFPLLNPEIKTNPDKQSVVITVGLPASGKSFVSKIVFPGFSLAGMDLNGTRPKALAEMEKLLKEKKSVIFDATSPSVENRNGIVEIAKKYNCDIYILYMNMPCDQAKKQNEQRSRTVPAIVYAKFAKAFEMPTDKEGQVIIYDF